MRELWWCFCFEGFSIKTRKIFWWGHSTLYSNLRMTFLLSRWVKTKHNAKGKCITSTINKIKGQFTDTCQSAILNLAHLKYILFRTCSFKKSHCLLYRQIIWGLPVVVDLFHRVPTFRHSMKLHKSNKLRCLCRMWSWYHRPLHLKYCYFHIQ